MCICVKWVMSKLYTRYDPRFKTYKSKYGEKKVSLLLRKAAVALFFICVCLVLLVMALFGKDLAIKEYLRTTYVRFADLDDFVEEYTYPLKHDNAIIVNVLITVMTSCGLILFYLWLMMLVSGTICCSRIRSDTYRQFFEILLALFAVYNVFVLILVSTYHFYHYDDPNGLYYKCPLLIYAIFHSVLCNFFSIHYAKVNFPPCKKLQKFTVNLSVMSGISQVGIIYFFLPLDMMIINLFYVMLAFIFPGWKASSSGP